MTPSVPLKQVGIAATPCTPATIDPVDRPSRLRPIDRPVPTSPPVYTHPGHPDRTGLGIEPSALIGSVFVALGVGLSLWLAVLYLREGFSLEPVRLLYLLGFWLLLTYVSLPRLHQVLTVLYLPDYFIGRTRTSVGVLSDPLNIALDGEEMDLHVAMRRAGWVLADERTIRSAWRMVTATLLRRSYAAAPMSDLHLMGRRHDFAYQQEVGGSTAKRHHVRFWRMPSDFVLPGGERVDWLAAGTYDRGVGFSLFTFQITHRIDEDIDIERDYIVDTLRYADPEVGVGIIEEFSTAYHHRNGQGDLLRTDGDLPVVDVRGAGRRSDGATAVMLPRHRPTGISVLRARALEGRGVGRQLASVARPAPLEAGGGTAARPGRGAHRAELADQVQQVVTDIQSAVDNAGDHHLPPATVLLAGAVVLAQSALVLWQWLPWELGRTLEAVATGAVVLVPEPTDPWASTILALLGLALMLGVLRRLRWCRLGLMALFTADAAVRLGIAAGRLDGSGEHGALALAGISVLGVMAITSDASRLWVLTPREGDAHDVGAAPGDAGAAAKVIS